MAITNDHVSAGTDDSATTKVSSARRYTGSTTQPRRRRKMQKSGGTSSRLLSIVGPLVVLALLIAGWYCVSYLALDASRRFLMPPPHVVATEGLFGPNIKEMLQGLVNTAQVSMVGLFLAIVVGVVWAIAMHQARWLESALFPYAVILQCIPILALVPLFGFWFGFEFKSRVLVCTIIALFPMVSNTLFGLKSVQPGYIDLFTLRHANRWTRLWKLDLPTALPAIFAGVRISAGLAVVGAIVSDFFFKQGSIGIGMLIDNYRARLQSPQLFAAVLIASLFGVLVFVFFGWLGERVVGKWNNTQR